MKLKSFAKVNLYLRVINKRPDGYHNIVTLFERIDLCDDIILRRRKKGIKIICNNPKVPKGPDNLVYKAAKALLDYSGSLGYGVEIEIIKRIPVAGGLAGGSSNAATVLKGLNILWDLGLSKKQLMEIGAKIGADVNFFLLDAKLAVGTGKGDSLKPLRPSKPIWHILVNPRKGLSTKEIYGLWDATNRGKISLTQALADVRILHHSIRQNNFILLSKSLHNDLEDSARAKNGTIVKINELLTTYGATGMLMSGSGPTVFAVMSSRKEAMELSSRLVRLKGNWQFFTARTC